jgi:ATP synthase F1 gamma subunit
MDTFSTYNKKLSGYKDVSETVKILEKIAAGKLHTLGQHVQPLSKYTSTILTMLSRVQQLSGKEVHSVYNTKQSARTLVVIITGDKGLVGDLWNRQFGYYKSKPTQDLLVIGKKGQQKWKESQPSIRHYSFSDRIPTAEEIYDLGEKLHSYIEDGVYQRVSTLHIQSLSLVDQKPVVTQLLPVVIPKKDFVSTADIPLGYPIVADSITSLQKTLFKKYMFSRLQQVILETAEAEFSARTVVMEHASTKTDEIIKRLHLSYFRDKRQSETQKQLERFAANHRNI